MPLYHTRTAKVSCHASRAREIILEMRRRYLDLKPQILDGIRIDFPDSWMLMRPSNTEPVMRITVEADTPQKADELLLRFEQELSGFTG
jgi:phosphomannomutase